jgi:hypothetical protein
MTFHAQALELMIAVTFLRHLDMSGNGRERLHLRRFLRGVCPTAEAETQRLVTAYQLATVGAPFHRLRKLTVTPAISALFSRIETNCVRPCVTSSRAAVNPTPLIVP